MKVHTSMSGPAKKTDALRPQTSKVGKPRTSSGRGNKEKMKASTSLAAKVRGTPYGKQS